MKVILMGSKNEGYECLQYLLRQGHEVLAVVTQDDPPERFRWYKLVRELAAEKGLPLFIPHKMKDPLFREAMLKLQPKAIFSVNFDKIIPKEILDSAKYNLNFHGGILPKYKGCLSGAWSIINGESETAVTAHIMEPSIDTGEIVGEKRVAILPEDTGLILYDKVSAATVELFKEVLPLLEKDQLKTRPQPKGESNYCRRDLPFKGMIDWSWPGKKIHHFIRAMNFPPFLPAKTNYKGGDLHIWETTLLPPGVKGRWSSEQDNGKIAEIAPQKGFVILAREQNVLVTTVRTQDRDLSAYNFALQENMKKGESLGI